MLRVTLKALALACLIALPVHAADTPNTLTDAERGQGFKLLFDGKTLDGWHSFQQKGTGKDWSVADGAIRLDRPRLTETAADDHRPDGPHHPHRFEAAGL